MFSSGDNTRGTIDSLTSLGILAHHVLDLASIHGRDALGFERISVLAGIEHATVIHGALERISLPSEYVVGMSAESTSVIVTHDEWVWCALWPLAVELSGVPQCLVGDLWHTDGMGGGAWSVILESIANGVIHVRLVVGRIEGLAIPAPSVMWVLSRSALHKKQSNSRREVMHSHDASSASLLGEHVELGEARAFVDQAHEFQTE